MSLLTDMLNKLECLCRKADALEARVTDLEAGGGGITGSTIDGVEATIDGTEVVLDGN